MTTERRQRARQRQQKIILTIVVILLLVVVVGVSCVGTVLKKYSPSKVRSNLYEYYNLTEEEQAVVVCDGTQMEERGYVYDGEGYISCSMVNQNMNRRFYWDGEEQILRYTAPEGTITVIPDSTEYQLDGETKTSEYALARIIKGEPYLALDFVQQHTDIQFSMYESPNRIVLRDGADAQEFVEVKKDTQLRELAGIKSPILTDVSAGDRVRVLDSVDSWSRVCSEDGFIGYTKSSNLGSTVSVAYESSFVPETYTHNLLDGKICLAWHQVTNSTANQYVGSILSSTSGVNVISPTWFYINDDQGNIVSYASADYVAYCHQQGVKVWGLVSNLENAAADYHRVLSVSSLRDRLVDNLISEALRCGMDGINVDFESLTTDDSAGYLQFIRELSVRCRANNLVLSVDNYVPSAYTELYHRDEQAVFADYVVLMAYDEHYSGSEAGSVASIGFVETGVENTLKEVPAEQLILGIPLYTRIWSREQTSDGGYTDVCESIGMADAMARVNKYGAQKEWQMENGQYYAEYEADGKTYRVWLEEEESITEKLKVMNYHNLAGAAFWKLGYENSSLWTVIADQMSR